VDVALFEGESGLVVRGGGLAGEPKTAAILFGAYLLVAFFTPWPRSWSARRNTLEFIVVLVATISFLLSFSTAGFVGFIPAAVFLSWRLKSEARLAKVRIFAASVVAVLILGVLLYEGGVQEMFELLRLRSFDRLAYGGPDEYTEAGLEMIANKPSVAFLGVGLGGSSFAIMQYTGENSNLTLTPSVGIVLMLLDLGLIGTGLFLGACWWLLRSPLPASNQKEYWPCCFMLCLGVSALSLQLASSGIYLGYPLSVASLGAFSMLSRQATIGKGTIILTPPQIKPNTPT
jgi:MFS family permease